MSELKTYNSERIYWAVEQVEREAGDIEDLHLDDTLFYLKSEADKEIDFWKKESRDHYERWFSLNKQFEGWFGKVMRCERAERELRRQKYNRCLDKANYWLAVSYHCIDDKHKQRAERRHYKWLELARWFKEQ